MKLWETFLVQQENELGAETVAKWLRPLKIVRYDACNLYLEAKDSFQMQWFEEHIRQKLLHSFVNNNNKKVRVHLTLTQAHNSKPKKTKPNLKKAPFTPSHAPFSLTFDELDPTYTFDHFLPTECNTLVYKLLCKLVDSNSELSNFNPIYIHGNSGTGKTHLLMAVAHALNAKKINVLYTRSETFTHHVVSAIRAGEMNIFRQAYRNSHVLIIDDVHLFSRKGATQEELFHTFNALHLEGKQIILSANCSPSELQMIEPRLVSRFEWGIVLPLEPLPTDLIPNLLEMKAKALRFPIHPKVTDFLLQTFTRGTKTITKALQALVLRCQLMEAGEQIPMKHLTVPQARHLLQDLMHEEEQSSLTPEKIIQAVAEHFGIKNEDILGKAQTRDFVIPRQFAMYFCRQNLKMPFMKIGALFSKDHSTVMSSVKTIQKGIDSNNADTREIFNSLEKKLSI